jgi:hypothetical protein
METVMPAMILAPVVLKSAIPVKISKRSSKLHKSKAQKIGSITRMVDAHSYFETFPNI